MVIGARAGHELDAHIAGERLRRQKLDDRTNQRVQFHRFALLCIARQEFMQFTDHLTGALCLM